MIYRPPRISLFALAEYATADVQRRHEIVRESLGDNEAAALRYSRARQAVRDALGQGPPYEARLCDMARDLELRTPQGEWDRSDLHFSSRGLRHLSDIVSTLNLGDRPPRARKRWPKMHLSGVKVSVAPDVVVREKQDGGTRIGAIKIRWNQRPMTKEEGEYASTLLRVSLKDVVPVDGFSATPRLCQIVDAFEQRVFAAPRAFKQRMGRIEKACNEFRLHWLDRQDDARDQPRRGDDDQPMPPQPGVH